MRFRFDIHELRQIMQVRLFITGSFVFNSEESIRSCITDAYLSPFYFLKSDLIF